ncbi:MAG: class I SAM-dependent methyltransferase [Candidatus Omnitrophota bacterium]
MKQVTSYSYDQNILREGLQHQVDNYYEPISFPMKKRIEIVLDKLLPQEGDKILDLGCGVGTFAYHSAKSKSFCVGLDYSLESVKMARALCLKFGVSEKTRFVVAVATHLPFKAAYFNKVVAADFIEHATDAEKVSLLKEVYRVTTKNALFVVFTPSLIRERLGELYWRLRHILFRHSVPHTDLHFGLISASGFNKLCLSQGFMVKNFYFDIRRPYLAKSFFFRRILALNLLFITRKR